MTETEAEADARFVVRDAGGLVLLTTPDRGDAEREAARAPGATIDEERPPAA